jgi:hypothetical protein
MPVKIIESGYDFDLPVNNGDPQQITITLRGHGTFTTITSVNIGFMGLNQPQARQLLLDNNHQTSTQGNFPAAATSIFITNMGPEDVFVSW